MVVDIRQDMQEMTREPGRRRGNVVDMKELPFSSIEEFKDFDIKLRESEELRREIVSFIY